MLRLGVPARAVASRLRLEGLTPATYEAALLGFSAQKAAAAASGSPLHPKRPARQRPLLLATLRNGDEGAGGGSAQAEAESVEEEEGPGQDRANHGAGSRGSSASGPLLLVRVRRNATADSFSPDDVLVFVMQPFTFFEFPRDVRFCVTATIFLVVYSNTHCFSSYIFLFMFLIFFFNFFCCRYRCCCNCGRFQVLTAPLWAADVRRGGGVVRSLVLRARQTPSQSWPLQSWPLAEPRCVAAVFDFAAASAPPAFAAAAAKTAVHSLHAAQGTAHGALVGLRASALLLVLGGGSEQDFDLHDGVSSGGGSSWFNGGSCCCGGSPGLSGGRTSDPGLTSIFPAVETNHSIF